MPSCPGQNYPELFLSLTAGSRRAGRLGCGEGRPLCWSCAVKAITLQHRCWECGLERITSETHLNTDRVTRWGCVPCCILYSPTSREAVVLHNTRLREVTSGVEHQLDEALVSGRCDNPGLELSNSWNVLAAPVTDSEEFFNGC